MPKRPANTEIGFSMESKSLKLHPNYDDGPLVSLLNSKGNIRPKLVPEIKLGVRNDHCSQRNAGCQRQQGLKNRPKLQKVDADTFKLISDDNISPDSVCNNPLTSKDLHTYSHNIAANYQNLCFTTTSSTTSKTSQSQTICKQKIHRTLLNKRKAHHLMLMPTASLPTKVFISVTGEQMTKYLQILETPIIAKFLRFDVCLRVTDKYLLAMAFAYFARAKLQPHEYTALNFFVALYLAHDVEEDEEDYKYEIFPWALGTLWRIRYKTLLSLRDELWKRMDYRAIVSRKCCEEIMAIEPDHVIWQRNRKEHHAGAIRPWLKDKHDNGKLIGPDGSPRHCGLCNYPPQPVESDHDSLSPNNDKLWLLMDSSSSSLEEYTAADITNASSGTTAGFNMNEIQKTLTLSSNSIGKNSSGRGQSLSGCTGDTTLDWVDCFSDPDDEVGALHRAEA